MRALLLAGLLLSGCSSINYAKVEPGRFSGSLFVMWVGEGSAVSGDGRFVFVPDPADRLTFTRPGGGTPIRPEMMYTDGGSIPKPAQLLRGFSPWGYAPAYVVHDWLFVARRCNRDGRASAEEALHDDMDFQTSAEIIAEAIKTLVASGRVARNDAAGTTISNTVTSPFSRAAWDLRGVCAERRVTEAHRRQAEAAFPGRAGLSRRRAGVAPARIVARVSFPDPP